MDVHRVDFWILDSGYWILDAGRSVAEIPISGLAEHLFYPEDWNPQTGGCNLFWEYLELVQRTPSENIPC